MLEPFVQVLVFPCTVLIDGNEQKPYLFEGLDPDLDEDIHTGKLRPYDFCDIKADAKDNRDLLLIPTRTHNLTWGDYSLDGLQHRISVERKTKSDLFFNMGGRRVAFEREIAALNTHYDYAAVVIEASWDDLLLRPPPHTKLNPRVVYRTMLSWAQKYPKVHWFPVHDRRLAELTTFRILERFWRGRLPT